jgi:hypothetical protein
MWMHEIDGNYSVKSGYMVIKDWQTQSSPPNATYSSEQFGRKFGLITPFLDIRSCIGVFYKNLYQLEMN